MSDDLHNEIARLHRENDDLRARLAEVEAERDAARRVACEHDWQEYWDGSLGYPRTLGCTRCREYRPAGDDRG